MFLTPWPSVFLNFVARATSLHELAPPKVLDWSLNLVWFTIYPFRRNSKSYLSNHVRSKNWSVLFAAAHWPKTIRNTHVWNKVRTISFWKQKKKHLAKLLAGGMGGEHTERGVCKKRVSLGFWLVLVDSKQGHGSRGHFWDGCVKEVKQFCH